MNFLTVVIRGLMRRPVRTGLTLVGISIGIAAVVALVGMSHGFEKSWTTGLTARGTDMVVSTMTRSLVPTPFDQSVRDRIVHLPRVADTCELLVEMMSVESSPMMMVSSREWGGFAWKNLKLVSGRMPKDASEPVVVLGTLAAEALNKKPGDTLTLETQDLTVVGIVDGGAIVEDGCVILSLPVLQQITDNRGKINVIDISATPSTSEAQMKELQAQVNAAIPEARAMLSSEHIGSSQAYRTVRAISWGTSLLAVVVGVVGVMNTMLMTVFERTHEICILLALGWKRSRIVRMVLWESAMLGLLGGVAGVIVGVAGVKALDTAPAIHGILEPDLSLQLMFTAVTIAVAVGILSGLYPAWRSSRLTPASALHGN
jgi:putative ABC transport system permease protein